MLHKVLLTSVLALTLPAAAALAAPEKPRSGPGEAPAGDKPFQEWKKVLKDSEPVPGFLTVHRKRENLYLELAPRQLGRPVLGVFSFARGLGQNFVLGGLPLNDRVIEFERQGDRILVLEKNVRFEARAGEPIDRAREYSLANSVLAALKIESIHDSSKAVLVDLAPLLVSDLTDLTERLRQSFNNKSMRFDKERSAITQVKSFPENTEIEALLTFSPNDRSNYEVEAVPDDRYLPVTVHYSFSKLPEKPMQPRLADDRVGYFLTAKKDFSRDDRESFWVRYVNRWRLEKKDPAAALSEPVKPIVYYIDHTIPRAYRPWVKEGVEKWQKAFEAAGFKNAIVAVEAPENDPDWDAEDVRYSTIRWSTSHQPSYSAIGPSRVDPRTGEILDADILFEAAMVQNYRNTYRRFAGPQAVADDVLPYTRLEQLPEFVELDRLCLAQDGLADAGALLRTSLLAEGALDPGSPVPEEFIRGLVTWVTMHEVGHTLGLRHNFRSSTATPAERLNDRAWIAENGMTGSVMDYATPNISPDHSHQGPYFGEGLGRYDLWAIRYGYAPSGSADEAEDYDFAAKIAELSMEPGHEYSTDEDTYPASALDPRTNIWDLGNDPLQFAKDRAGYISGLWKNGRLEDRVVGPDGDLTVLRRAMDTLLGQYGIALGLAVKYVGGQYHVRAHRGQPGATDPFVPVPAARQREALEFIGQRAFAADAFKLSPTLLNRLAPERWSHWGVPSPFSGQARPDYELNDKALSIQTRVLDGLLNPTLLTRLSEAESRSAEPFKLPEHFNRMTRLLWGEVGGGAGTASAFKALEGPTTRRDLQRAYLDRLATMVASPAPGTPDDARALARLQLSRIDGRAARVLAGQAPVGDYVRAHLLESRARIKRALEATRDADVPRATSGPLGRSATP